MKKIVILVAVFVVIMVAMTACSGRNGHPAAVKETACCVKPIEVESIEVETILVESIEVEEITWENVSIQSWN